MNFHTTLALLKEEMKKLPITQVTLDEGGLLSKEEWDFFLTEPNIYLSVYTPTDIITIIRIGQDQWYFFSENNISELAFEGIDSIEEYLPERQIDIIERIRKYLKRNQLESEQIPIYDHRSTVDFVKDLMMKLPIDNINPPVGQPNQINEREWERFLKTPHTTLSIYIPDNILHLTRIGQNRWHLSFESSDREILTFDNINEINNYLTEGQIEIIEKATRFLYDRRLKTTQEVIYNSQRLNIDE